MCVTKSVESGISFSKAKALLEGVNRGAIHISLLALYGLGGATPRNREYCSIIGQAAQASSLQLYGGATISVASEALHAPIHTLGALMDV